MCPPPRSPCIRIASSTRTPPSAGRRARYMKGRATSRSSARTGTSIPRSSRRIAPFRSRRRCSSRRITTSSGCSSRRASRWSRWACRPAIRRPRSSAIRGRSGDCSPSNYHLFRGTPTRAWLDYELHELFGVRERLDAESADRIYDQIAERLKSPEFRPRALFDSFNIEVLATTDAATDALAPPQDDPRVGLERACRADLPPGRAVPDRAPDVARRARGAGARDRRARSRTYARFRQALVARRAAFRALGATATDHAVVEPFTERLAPDDGRGDCSRRRSRGEATPRRTRSASRRTC